MPKVKHSRPSYRSPNALPWNMGSEHRKALEKAGVIFGDIIPENDMLVHVTMPAGWHKVETKDRGWLDLMDDKGRRRAIIYYVAPPTHHSCVITNTRFIVRIDFDYDDSHHACRTYVLDCGKIAFVSTAHAYFGDRSTVSYNSALEAALSESEFWLERHYPDWQSFSAYWD